MARPAATSRITAHRSAIKLDLQCSDFMHNLNGRFFFGQGSSTHTYTHMHSHTYFLLFILFLCTCVCDSVHACRGGYFEMFNFLAGISEYSTGSVI